VSSFFWFWLSAVGGLGRRIGRAELPLIRYPARRLLTAGYILTQPPLPPSTDERELIPTDSRLSINSPRLDISLRPPPRKIPRPIDGGEVNL
jgi:hypothetical protein